MRASLNDPAIVDEICERLVAGEGIKNIGEDTRMPSARAIYMRMSSDAEFSARIARAREAQQEAEVERCVELADEATAEDWQVKKLQIWARQWRAAKLAPKKYGDKIDHTTNGKELPASQVSVSLPVVPIDASKAYEDFIKGRE